ncbi:MAG: hypothetical protein Q4Q06_05325 [Bacteroidota bacterium]|nr:hypothetical protein [Bacteroidota bacterium]
MDIPNNPNGIVLYDNDLSISNMKNTVSQGNVIYPRGVVLVDEEGTEASIADLAMSLRKNGYQVIDKENNETYDPDDMTLIIDSNSIYKKNNNTGTVSLVYKLKDNDTFTLMPVEDSAFFDAPNYYKMDLEKGERLHLTKYTKANDSSYIELGYVNGSAYISVMCGLWNPYILHPIKEEKPL